MGLVSLPMLYLYPFVNAFSCGVKVLVLESVLLSLRALLRESYPVKTNILHAKHHSIPLIPSVLLAWLLTLCLLVTPHSAAVSMCLGSHKNISKITPTQMFKRSFRFGLPIKAKNTFTHSLFHVLLMFSWPPLLVINDPVQRSYRAS